MVICKKKQSMHKSEYIMTSESNHVGHHFRRFLLPPVWWITQSEQPVFVFLLFPPILGNYSELTLLFGATCFVDYCE